MSIPLVQEATKDAINTSIIAIKRNIERINMLLGLSNSEEIDTSGFVKKSDIVDEVEAGNMNPVTSNAVVPVDEVTSGNMQSVSSNAVAEALGGKRIKVIKGEYTVNSGYIQIDPEMEDTNYIVFVQKSYNNADGYFFTVQQYQARALYIYVRTYTNALPANGTKIRLNILIVY